MWPLPMLVIGADCLGNAPSLEPLDQPWACELRRLDLSYPIRLSLEIHMFATSYLYALSATVLSESGAIITLRRRVKKSVEVLKL